MRVREEVNPARWSVGLKAPWSTRRAGGGDRRLFGGGPYPSAMNRVAIQRWVDERLVALGERSAKRLWPAFPYTLRLDHPATAYARPRYGFGQPAHPELERLLSASAGRYRAELEGFQPYFEELADLHLDGEHLQDPCWLHSWLAGLDTVSLYGFTRERRPNRYVEIGSGQSTKVVARARRDGETGTVITSVDPMPRSEIDGLCDRGVRKPLEKADLAGIFDELEGGDIVFFDGSHRVLPNSDCVVFFLEVLPNLPAGVLVGIHDVYLPEDYPQVFFEMWWSEQYVLAAMLLTETPGFEVVLPTFYASGRPELAALLDPLFGRPHLRAVNPRGSLFWLETTGPSSGAE